MDQRSDVVWNTDFTKNARQSPVIPLDSGNYSFTTNVKINFRCDASGNQDDIYIDDIRILAKEETGCEESMGRRIVVYQPLAAWNPCF